jgi:signal peptidase I
MGWVLMSERDVRRIEVLTEVLSGKRTSASAADVLAITTRQVRRLLDRLRDDGGCALHHKGRGQASNHRHAPGIRTYALELVRTKYADFGPTLAIEILLRKVQREHEKLMYRTRNCVNTENQAGDPQVNEARGEDGGVVAKEGTETLLESLSSICAVLAVGLFVMTFVFQNFVIPSGSMEKTLLIGDHVLVDRITFAPSIRWAPFVHYREPQRGDVIVFLKPNPETPDLILVKRLIGVPGDRIHLVHGVVYLNGVIQNESYAAMPKHSSDPDDEYSAARDDFPTRGTPAGSFEVWSQELPSHLQDGDLVVPPGNYFAMGDNREHSADGRFWGFVPRENILGRPLFNYWSFETTANQMDAQQEGLGARIGSFFTTALHVLDKTRWSRTGHLIR